LMKSPVVCLAFRTHVNQSSRCARTLSGPAREVYPGRSIGTGGIAMESIVGLGTIFLSSTVGIGVSFLALWFLLNVTGNGR